MTMDEAIKALTVLKEPESLLDTEKLHKAIQLGIEALKFITILRTYAPIKIFDLLPGETEGED